MKDSILKKGHDIKIAIISIKDIVSACQDTSAVYQFEVLHSFLPH